MKLKSNSQILKNKLINSIVAASLAFSLLIIVAVIFFNRSHGWFSYNTQTNATGMSIKIDSPPNLIISNSPVDISSSSFSSINDGNPFSIDNGSNNNYYSPSTHDSDYTNFSTGLKYVTNTDKIGITSGTGLQQLYYGNAANNGTTNYYIDFIIYVAASRHAIENAKLVVSINSALKSSSEVTSGSLMATSIDFYNSTTISSENYLGTLNVAGLDASLNDYTTTKTSLYLLGDASNNDTIPLNTSSYLTYTLRCYFDGALLSGSNQAFINSATLDLSKVLMNIKIEAIEE